jgi:dipeptidyl-peptidase 4
MPNSARRNVAVIAATVFLLLLAHAPAIMAQQAAHAGELTVDRIYGQPSLSGRLTRGVWWTPDGRKISFIDVKGQGKEAMAELWEMDAATGERSLLVSAEKLESILPAPAGKQSQATGAGRHAPPQYQWAPGGEALLFEGANSLGWFELKSQTAKVLVTGKDEISDMKISPNGQYVSFVRGHNLWLVSTADGKERAFTTGGTEEIRKGELDWVYPEELELFTAYWWAPDSNSIAYLEMNESKVTEFPLVNFESYTGESEQQRYPVAGGNNPVVRVLVGSVNGGEPRVMDIGAETDIYIPRVNWLPDAKRIAIQRLNRAQNELNLLIADAGSGKTSVLLSEKDPAWINVSDDLQFLKDGKRFLWTSERFGYRHIYLYGMDGKEHVQLTKGDWEVSRIAGVDEAKGVVYFTAKEKSPIESHLYRVALDGKGFSRITKDEGTHSVQVSPDAQYYVDTYSNSSTPQRQELYRTDGAKTATLNENNVAELAQFHLSPLEFLTVAAKDGMALNCYLIKPPQFDPTKKYPVIVFTYGGPHAQVVMNAWQGPTLLWHEMMAQKGYVIFALDNRGSAGRGHVFEAPIHYRFGIDALSDQGDGVAWLKKQPWVDGKRIGIWGWSFGGFMATLAMLEAPDDFKVGFAGGPVTDWHFYDSIYTERYMGLPKEHEQDYVNCSPVKYAAGLKGRLLIAHGTGDDNVHYSNTLTLIDDLIREGKYVEVIAAPGRGHGVSDPPARKIVWDRVTQFFLNNL